MTGYCLIRLKGCGVKATLCCLVLLTRVQELNVMMISTKVSTSVYWLNLSTTLPISREGNMCLFQTLDRGASEADPEGDKVWWHSWQ
jgi:hypothetical protein